MSERVLVTGASGFIGCHLVEALLEKGYEVDAAVRKSSNLNDLEQVGKSSDKLSFVYPDYSSKNLLRSLICQGAYSYIIHAAGVTRAKTQSAYNEVNAEYTLNLAEAVLEAEIPLKRFVFVSSLAAVGPIDYSSEKPLNDRSPLKPVTSYGKSKQLAEQYLLGLPELPLTTIRPTAVYGPGEKDIFILFQTLNKGFDLYIGKEPQWLSFVYVKDLVTAILASFKELEEKHTVYNISDGERYNRYELADCFRKVSGKKPFRLHVPLFIIQGVAASLEVISSLTGKMPVLNREKIGELTAENWNCSIAAAQNKLNYHPQYGLAKGVEETLKWYKEKSWL